MAARTRPAELRTQLALARCLVLSLPDDYEEIVVKSGVLQVAT